MSYSIDCVVPGAARLGEGLVWDIQDQLLWWVDITGGIIHSYDPVQQQLQNFHFGEQVGSIGRRQAGGLVVAAQSGFWFFNPETGEKSPISDPEADIPENRFNDGTIDPAGRFWAGTMKDGGTPEKQGNFYLLDTDLSVQKWNQTVFTTNGLAFSPDGETMYFSDSNRAVRTIWKCAYDVDTGQASAAETFLDTHALAGRPDGGTVDAEGCYWMAGVGGWQIYRITPDGNIDMTIDVPVEKPTKPMFGGAGLDTLFVSSIGFGLTPGSEAQQPEAGGLFAISDLGITGLPQPRFAGQLLIHATDSSDFTPYRSRQGEF